MISNVPLPESLLTNTGSFTLRRACHNDLSGLVTLLADDTISAGRGDRAASEDTTLYETALEELIADPSNEILVVVDEGDWPVATMQLTRIPGLSRRGSTRLLVEAVRVANNQRSNGLGSAMMKWVIDVAARATGASLVQLTSDAARVDAHRFYERLGFVGSHRGFKFQIEH
ncbi:GNAT family N-acetyltransferase [Nesterenkonia halotolerans]|uniref:GNAT superfamily N-acetyltransferase n=1 Tax=Nesterenkonia halotolerans TaxID=225325 RepID=A0ABR9J3X5_9MICC|nr:GNAT family N-acetyltransferase [Nesterenkonia halotolerans]MBE1513713.1 GNAT superfamily N-acetyltransferase [Nesterenkonia halotolerans]